MDGTKVCQLADMVNGVDTPGVAHGSQEGSVRCVNYSCYTYRGLLEYTLYHYSKESNKYFQ